MQSKLPADGDPIERLIKGVMVAADIAAADPHISSYYSGRSAEDMLQFVTASPSLRNAVAPVIAELTTDLEGILDRSLTLRDLTEWVFRLFVSELLCSLASDHPRAERETSLRLLVTSPFRQTTSG